MSGWGSKVRAASEAAAFRAPIEGSSSESCDSLQQQHIVQASEKGRECACALQQYATRADQRRSELYCCGQARMLCGCCCLFRGILDVNYRKKQEKSFWRTQSGINTLNQTNICESIDINSCSESAMNKNISEEESFVPDKQQEEVRTLKQLFQLNQFQVAIPKARIKHNRARVNSVLRICVNCSSRSERHSIGIRTEKETATNEDLLMEQETNWRGRKWQKLSSISEEGGSGQRKSVLEGSGFVGKGEMEKKTIGPLASESETRKGSEWSKLRSAHELQDWRARRDFELGLASGSAKVELDLDLESASESEIESESESQSEKRRHRSRFEADDGKKRLRDKCGCCLLSHYLLAGAKLEEQTCCRRSAAFIESRFSSEGEEEKEEEKREGEGEREEKRLESPEKRERVRGIRDATETTLNNNPTNHLILSPTQTVFRGSECVNWRRTNDTTSEILNEKEKKRTINHLSPLQNNNKPLWSQADNETVRKGNRKKFARVEQVKLFSSPRIQQQQQEEGEEEKPTATSANESGNKVNVAWDEGEEQACKEQQPPAKSETNVKVTTRVFPRRKKQNCENQPALFFPFNQNCTRLNNNNNNINITYDANLTTNHTRTTTTPRARNKYNFHRERRQTHKGSNTFAQNNNNYQTSRVRFSHSFGVLDTPTPVVPLNEKDLYSTNPTATMSGGRQRQTGFGPAQRSRSEQLSVEQRRNKRPLLGEGGILTEQSPHVSVQPKRSSQDQQTQGRTSATLEEKPVECEQLECSSPDNSFLSTTNLHPLETTDQRTRMAISIYDPLPRPSSSEIESNSMAELSTVTTMESPSPMRVPFRQLPLANTRGRQESVEVECDPLPQQQITNTKISPTSQTFTPIERQKNSPRFVNHHRPSPINNNSEYQANRPRTPFVPQQQHHTRASFNSENNLTRRGNFQATDARWRSTDWNNRREFRQQVVEYEPANKREKESELEEVAKRRRRRRGSGKDGDEQEDEDLLRESFPAELRKPIIETGERGRMVGANDVISGEASTKSCLWSVASEQFSEITIETPDGKESKPLRVSSNLSERELVELVRRELIGLSSGKGSTRTGGDQFLLVEAQEVARLCLAQSVQAPARCQCDQSNPNDDNNNNNQRTQMKQSDPTAMSKVEQMRMVIAQSGRRQSSEHEKGARDELSETTIKRIERSSFEGRGMNQEAATQSTSAPTNFTAQHSQLGARNFNQENIELNSHSSNWCNFGQDQRQTQAQGKRGTSFGTNQAAARSLSQSQSQSRSTLEQSVGQRSGFESSRAQTGANLSREDEKSAPTFNASENDHGDRLKLLSEKEQLKSASVVATNGDKEKGKTFPVSLYVSAQTKTKTKTASESESENVTNTEGTDNARSRWPQLEPRAHSEFERSSTNLESERQRNNNEEEKKPPALHSTAAITTTTTPTPSSRQPKQSDQSSANKTLDREEARTELKRVKAIEGAKSRWQLRENSENFSKMSLQCISPSAICSSESEFETRKQASANNNKVKAKADEKVDSSFNLKTKTQEAASIQQTSAQVANQKASLPLSYAKTVKSNRGNGSALGASTVQAQKEPTLSSAGNGKNNNRSQEQKNSSEPIEQKKQAAESAAKSRNNNNNDKYPTCVPLVQHQAVKLEDDLSRQQFALSEQNKFRRPKEKAAAGKLSKQSGSQAFSSLRFTSGKANSTNEQTINSTQSETTLDDNYSKSAAFGQMMKRNLSQSKGAQQQQQQHSTGVAANDCGSNDGCLSTSQLEQSNRQQSKRPDFLNTRRDQGKETSRFKEQPMASGGQQRNPTKIEWRQKLGSERTAVDSSAPSLALRGSCKWATANSTPAAAVGPEESGADKSNRSQQRCKESCQAIAAVTTAVGATSNDDKDDECAEQQVLSCPKEDQETQVASQSAISSSCPSKTQATCVPSDSVASQVRSRPQSAGMKITQVADSLVQKEEQMAQSKGREERGGNSAVGATSGEPAADDEVREEQPATGALDSRQNTVESRVEWERAEKGASKVKTEAGTGKLVDSVSGWKKKGEEKEEEENSNAGSASASPSALTASPPQLKADRSEHEQKREAVVFQQVKEQKLGKLQLPQQHQVNSSYCNSMSICNSNNSSSGAGNCNSSSSGSSDNGGGGASSNSGGISRGKSGGNPNRRVLANNNNNHQNKNNNSNNNNDNNNSTNLDKNNCNIINNNSNNNNCNINRNKNSNTNSSNNNYYYNNKSKSSEASALLQQPNTTSDMGDTSNSSTDQLIIIESGSNNSSTEQQTEDNNVIETNETKQRKPANNRSILILREIDPRSPESSVRDIFNSENCPSKPVHCEYALHNSWYVTFKDDEDAKLALAYIRKHIVTWNGQPIMARYKPKPAAPQIVPSLVMQGVPDQNGSSSASSTATATTPGLTPSPGTMLSGAPTPAMSTGSGSIQPPSTAQASGLLPYHHSVHIGHMVSHPQHHHHHHAQHHHHHPHHPHPHPQPHHHHPHSHHHQVPGPHHYGYSAVAYYGQQGPVVNQWHYSNSPPYDLSKVFIYNGLTPYPSSVKQSNNNNLRM